MSQTTLASRDVDHLRASLAGTVVAPEDETYDEVRALFNSMIDKRPAVIARCADAADVAAAVSFAATHELEVAVRSGGHSVAGTSATEGGLVIDVRPIDHIEIDPEARTARVGTGVTWGAFDRAAQEHGLAVTGGRVSTTGVSGFTLGGGSGWIERAHGLACDNLVSVDLVLADGSRVRASASENADLFWALHGGGGNFGVATELVFQLHPVGPVVTAGLMLWPEDAGPELAHLYREVAESAPETFGSGLVALTGPPEDFVPDHLQGQRLFGVAACGIGPAEEAGEVVGRLRALDPAVDLVGPMPYADFQCMIDDPPGQRNYWSAQYLNGLSDGAITSFLADSAAMPAPLSQNIIFQWGGAVARVADGDTPMANRDATWVAHPFAVWSDAADDEASIAWARGASDRLRQFSTGGTYLNFIGDEGQERIRAAFGDANYARLATIKRQYDPDNVFHLNQNIRPA